jgi:L-fucose isomerase-like protein
MKGAEAIYERLKEIIKKNHLDGITVRCFDLFKTIKNTGCLAVSKLNDEGIPAGCESDIPVLLTMMACKKLTGEPGWMANPARIQSDGQILLAKCTIALSMTAKHEFTTHFESGIGVGIRGFMKEGPVTVCKVSGDLKRHFSEEGMLVENQSQPDLCRTQQLIQLSNPQRATYFLTEPIGNHHVILPGRHKRLFDDFLK